MNYQLAEINVARLRFGLEDPRMAEFVAALDPINHIAENTPGFIWRLKGEDGRSSSFIAPVFAPDMLVNLSVWESLETLKHFTYQSGHSSYFRRRLDWFEPTGRPSTAMWWIRVGQFPSTEQAKALYDHLVEHGSSEKVFSFKNTYPAPLE